MLVFCSALALVARVTALTGSGYTHPWESTQTGLPIIVADHVTADAGTGVVHTAPAHGLDDYVACARHGIDMGPVLVDDDGLFAPLGVGHGCGGKPVLGAGNEAVLARLEATGVAAHREDYEHRYPYDWRTRKPVIMRATEQWFADLAEVAPAAEAALSTVTMVPETGRQRLTAMLRSRADWCISRQRAWGVPIPVLYELTTGEPLLTDASFEHIAGLVAEHGTDCWWWMDTEQLVAPEHRGDGRKYRRGLDTMDVWFDSGTSWAAVTAAREGPGAIADLYLEGSDQHRGWFQSSLLTSVAGRGRGPAGGVAPFKTVLTHGFVVDQNGRKMSKSLGNGVDPAEVVEGGSDKKAAPAYGADVLRLWAASATYSSDVGIGPDTAKLTSEQLRRFRNCGRFLLGNLADFDPATDSVDRAELRPIDRYMLHQLAALDATIVDMYEQYQFASVCDALSSFMTGYLNGFCFEIYKDRLYLEPSGSATRRAAQTVMEHVLRVLTRGLAPIACHLAEELHSFRSGIDPAVSPSASVLDAGWPKPDTEWDDPVLAAEWDLMRGVRRIVYKAIDQARDQGVVAGIADAEVIVETAHHGLHEILTQANVAADSAGVHHRTELEDVLLCARVTVDYVTSTHIQRVGPGARVVHSPPDSFVELLEHCQVPIVRTSANTGSETAMSDVPVHVTVTPTTAAKCPRCWRHTSTAPDVLCDRCSHVCAE